MRLRLPAALVVAGALLLTSCGGASKSSSSSTSSTTTTASSPTQTTTPSSKKPKARLTQEVRVASTTGAKFAAAATAGTGDEVQFRTVVPGQATARPTTVNLTIASSAGHITATGKAAGQTSAATLSTGGKPLKLNGLHYICTLPPAPGFCPLRHLKTTKSGGYRMQFSTRPTVPAIFVATLARSAAPPARKARPTTAAVVPPYTVVTRVRSITPNPNGVSGVPPKYATTTSAHPGDNVGIATELTGKLTGAPQLVTIKISQGPGKSIAVSGSVPGGQPAKATINSATGAPIALVLGRYSCYLPPYPTFCPPASASVANRQYTITVHATPNTPQIIVLTKAQKG